LQTGGTCFHTEKDYNPQFISVKRLSRDCPDIPAHKANGAGVGPMIMASETIGDRLRRLRTDRRMKLREVGSAIGITPQGVSNYENGSSVPSLDRISALSRLFSVSERYLLTGVNNQADSDRMLTTPPGGRVVPVYTASNVVLNIFAKPLGQVTTHFPCGPKSYVVSIWDDSNSPEFQAPDQVVLDPDITPAPGDMVLVASADQHPLPLFGRYLRRLVGGIQSDVLQHLNPLWGEVVLSPTSSGRVVAVMTEHAKPRRRS
jgi:DNA-binding XRE family transcriptional regulator